MGDLGCLLQQCYSQLTRSTPAKGTLPSYSTVSVCTGLPQREVFLVFFVRLAYGCIWSILSTTCLRFMQFQVCEFPVPRKGGRPVVDRITTLVCVASLEQCTDHVRDLIDMLGRFRVHARLYYIQRLQISIECLSVLVGDCFEGPFLEHHFVDDFIVHICQVAYMIHFVLAIPQPALHYVVYQECSEVPDVCEVVNCGSAAATRTQRHGSQQCKQ